jgi:hypothetical protein
VGGGSGRAGGSRGADALQAGGPLGERLTEALEWAGVLEQVAALGWTRLDLRCRAAPRTPHSPAECDKDTVIVCMIFCGQTVGRWSSIGQTCG